MTVSVKFSDRAWGRLAVIADRNGVSVPQLLEGGAIALGVGTPAQKVRAAQKAVRVAHVISLREQGWKVAQIAEKVGVSTSLVSRVLCENGHRSHTERSTR